MGASSFGMTPLFITVEITHAGGREGEGISDDAGFCLNSKFFLS